MPMRENLSNGVEGVRRAHIVVEKAQHLEEPKMILP